MPSIYRVRFAFYGLIYHEKIAHSATVLICGVIGYENDNYWMIAQYIIRVGRALELYDMYLILKRR